MNDEIIVRTKLTEYGGMMEIGFSDSFGFLVIETKIPTTNGCDHGKISLKINRGELVEFLRKAIACSKVAWESDIRDPIPSVSSDVDDDVVQPVVDKAQTISDLVQEAKKKSAVVDRKPIEEESDVEVRSVQLGTEAMEILSGEALPGKGK